METHVEVSVLITRPGVVIFKRDLHLMKTCDMFRTFVGLHQIVVTLFGGSRTEIKQKCKEAEDQLRFVLQPNHSHNSIE